MAFLEALRVAMPSSSAEYAGQVRVPALGQGAADAAAQLGAGLGEGIGVGVEPLPPSIHQLLAIARPRAEVAQHLRRDGEGRLRDRSRRPPW